MAIISVSITTADQVVSGDVQLAGYNFKIRNTGTGSIAADTTVPGTSTDISVDLVTGTYQVIAQAVDASGGAIGASVTSASFDYERTIPVPATVSVA